MGDAEGWPFRLTFERDETGVVSGFRLDGPALVWGRLTGPYPKLA